MTTSAYRRTRIAGLTTLILATFCYGLTWANATGAEDALTAAKCNDCHRLTPPAPEQRTVSNWYSRRGPDLFDAGSKYRPEWLRAWLQVPERIRPAGLNPAQHVQTIDGVDHLDASTLKPHPRVSAADADALVQALMGYTWGRELLPADVNLTPMPRPLAELNFIKFKGCGSCHRTSEKFGGLTGPELYTAWPRLRPDYLWSYVANPQAWEPVAPMPGYDLPPTEVGKLLKYLRLLSEERHHDP